MDRTCELLALESFSGYISSSACIENRNHFHRHRDQILIGSLVNSKQVNGENCKKKHLQPGCRCTCTLAITTSPPQKNSPDLHQPQEWSLAKAGWTTPWRRPWSQRAWQLIGSVYLDYQLHLLFAFAATMLMVNKDYQNERTCWPTTNLVKTIPEPSAKRVHVQGQMLKSQ